MSVPTLASLIRETAVDGRVLTFAAPSWVQTDMGNTGAQAVGMPEAPVTLEQSVSGMLDKARSNAEGREGRRS